ncbi:MAG: FtsW/RodA/SpoVE family cell cycle protein, partial [Anaerolineales bacterium]
MQYYKIWRHFDVLLLAAVAIMTISGVAIIRSAIAGNETLLGLPTRQAQFSLAGFVVVILLAAIDYRIWSSLTRLIYAVTIVLLGGISAAGIAGFGSQRWFQVGTLFLQPSEIAKVAMILVLANFFDRNRDRLHRTGTIIRSLMWL